MWTVIAYVLVLLLVRFCSSLATWFVGFPLALLLAWTSMKLRTTVVGVIAGIAGVAFAVATGFGIFHRLVGPNSFTLGAFFASTAPLLITVRSDYLQSQRVAAAREQLLDTVVNTRGDEAAKAMAEQTETAHGPIVIGQVLGLALAVAWFVSQYRN